MNEDERSRADGQPDDVRAQIEAAYACDLDGDEHHAVRYYDAAWQLGVPAEARTEFLVGYGSTLRNVGRVDESISMLQAAVQEQPGHIAFHAFLGLALHAAGRHNDAIASMIDALVIAGKDQLGGYDRALTSYAGVLRE